MAAISVSSPFPFIRFVLILFILSRLNALSNRKLETANPLNVSRFFNFHPNATYQHQGEGYGFPLFSISATTAAVRPSFLINALRKTTKSHGNANLSASKVAATASVPFNYSDTLMVEVLVGTPPQKQRMGSTQAASSRGSTALTRIQIPLHLIPRSRLLTPQYPATPPSAVKKQSTSLFPPAATPSASALSHTRMPTAQTWRET